MLGHSQLLNQSFGSVPELLEAREGIVVVDEGGHIGGLEDYEQVVELVVIQLLPFQLDLFLDFAEGLILLLFALGVLALDVLAEQFVEDGVSFVVEIEVLLGLLERNDVDYLQFGLYVEFLLELLRIDVGHVSNNECIPSCLCVLEEEAFLLLLHVEEVPERAQVDEGQQVIINSFQNDQILHYDGCTRAML